MKNILLAITGASPQVVTETLYALHTEGKTFPDEMFVITTTSTKAMLMEGLFDNGHLAGLQQEHGLPDFKFDESHIWLIEDEDGNPIDDAKTIEDQTYMADFITHKVFELTNQEEVAIHASIAGGRKTMAFYLGYAMSLLGRPQDTLSHVFVNDEFEFVKDFYYPTKTTNWITGKFGKCKLDTSQAKITLAEIPFVRMRQSVDPQLITSMGEASFSQTVATINSTHSKSLVLDLYQKAKTISVSGVDIKLTAKEFSFYIWLLKLTQKNNNGLIVDRKFEDNTDASLGFLNECCKVGTDIRVFKAFNIEPEDFRDGDLQGLSAMERAFVQQNRSAINKKLRKALPLELVKKIDIASDKDGHDQKYYIAAVIDDIEINFK
ncbi:TIGR02584 family CRISPR-associated protein [Colwellia sp. BRX8-2]|jgi:CRISPR-associated protein (TIGR02584 family)|uniref:CRISPR-associated ring nuclease Csm6 n=1 Tax=unclassified Colwellia TaxID=196834 RepID=UPI0015F57D92|nr:MULTISPECIES: CRISPR-associated ring nuclease Csm6 [unclassified Colwellia]MBA6361670.1 TIGR02584 family CRISPR-associated protein [Colwellia sp. BRX8-6]MBA6367575.1 TIGR02584 family CRISPR-associated protein [Colwellia sp. BRX8-5]MBA6375049.1 TIGR02584 family CRISPR-associated protein [Colwellia sp. BRX8-2]